MLVWGFQEAREQGRPSPWAGSTRGCGAAEFVSDSNCGRSALQVAPMFFFYLRWTLECVESCARTEINLLSVNFRHPRPTREHSQPGVGLGAVPVLIHRHSVSRFDVPNIFESDP